MSHLCKIAFWIRLIVTFESLRCALIVHASIFSHGQHIKTFLSVVCSFLNINEVGQQRNCLSIFPFCITFFGEFVLILIIISFIYFIEFLRTTCKKQCNAYRNQNLFLHIKHLICKDTDFSMIYKVNDTLFRKILIFITVE